MSLGLWSFLDLLKFAFGSERVSGQTTVGSRKTGKSLNSEDL